MKVAVVGATGLVGRMICQILEERNFPVTELIPVASNRSKGIEIFFKSKTYTVCTIEEAIRQKPHIAIFSAGKETSLKYAASFAKVGCRVIDNSSAWRMHDNIKLIVPEINGNLLTSEDMIIANPNCSTIQLVVAISELHRKLKIKRLVISTYQAVSGSGNKALSQMWQERSGEKVEEMVYPYPIDLNCIPHGGDFEDNGYTSEEMKLVNETRKILDDNSLQITATVVRIPVQASHSESVNIEFEKEFEMENIFSILKNTEGVIIKDDPANFKYPVPLETAGKDEVFVGRIRRDETVANAVNLWIVSDNLRKGAATNAVQIAELFI